MIALVILFITGCAHEKHIPMQTNPKYKQTLWKLHKPQRSRLITNGLSGSLTKLKNNIMKKILTLLILFSLGCTTQKYSMFTYEDYLKPMREVFYEKAYITRCACYPPDTNTWAMPLLPKTKAQLDDARKRGFDCHLISTLIEQTK